MSNDTCVIVGAGHAARRAAETLRSLDADVRIVMIGAEGALPYDRPVLSKDALTRADGEARAFIRDAAWYAAQRIELRLGMRVDAIDRAERRVLLADGTAFKYDRLLIATGSRVRAFPGPVDEGVVLHYVRTVEDARGLRAALLPGKRVVVLGGGFIGLEVAASARTLGCETVVIEAAPRVLHRSMPVEIGEYMQALHRARGVDVRVGTPVLAIRRNGGGCVVDTQYGAVEADVVVVGIGVVPNVELAQEAGLETEDGVVVDAQCRTSDSFVFAAGEVTSHFNPLLMRHVRVESWQVAENQPAVAAGNMLGGDASYAEIPWLWSDQYDCNVQMLGVVDHAHSRVVRGDLTTGAFSFFALDGESRLAGAVTVNAGSDMAVCKRLLNSGKALDAAKLADRAVMLRSLL
ncbi:anthranilate 1,2-dioxygenase system ferredoxin--NAD(+) reductase [Caballeronia sp. LZ035]|uniref:anthranilate 1,2-dioxygenase system ferredoxin--NAD(+) reductase n=1 Tax=Caballeronia sp. LZ035 TaxID=3038568 RepID=UPI00285E779B|nr:anthranilate 1,2-dioxygenase system ferredoxin--NAD(+) reductase [Caballeronia sp. LZ035]MDR5758557.1 FAD-dependent oxidoreductase [Caballeronia sp. LZ035]